MNPPKERKRKITGSNTNHGLISLSLGNGWCVAVGSRADVESVENSDVDNVDVDVDVDIEVDVGKTDVVPHAGNISG